MSNIQNKIGMSLFKIQESIDKGINKVDSFKEVAIFNKVIEDVSMKKLEKIIEMGLKTNKKIRDGKIIEEDLIELYNSIKGFDYIIYENRKKLDEINIKNTATLCECGNELNECSKFCSKCGKKIIIDNIDVSNFKCNNCEMDIPDNSKYCPCCGIKLD